jgi:hypothetical protein
MNYCVFGWIKRFVLQFMFLYCSHNATGNVMISESRENDTCVVSEYADNTLCHVHRTGTKPTTDS